MGSPAVQSPGNQISCFQSHLLCEIAVWSQEHHLTSMLCMWVLCELGMPTFPPVGAVHKKCDVEGKGPCSCRNSVMQGVIIIIAPPIKTILPFFISKVSCGFWRGWEGGYRAPLPTFSPSIPRHFYSTTNSLCVNCRKSSQTCIFIFTFISSVFITPLRLTLSWLLND